MTNASRRRTALISLAGVLGLACGAAHAELLYAQTSYLRGTSASLSTFDVPSGGTVTVQLTDLAWPDRLASLSFAATTATSVLTKLTGPGEVSFDVSAPGTYFAIVAGTVSSTSVLGLGAYSLTIDFAPTVPLPASAWLLVSALLGYGLSLLGRRLPLPSLQLRPL